MIAETLISIAVLSTAAFAQFCSSGYVDLNGGTPCSSNAFCATFDSRFKCIHGYCCSAIGATCSNPNHQEERELGVMKNCLYKPCSMGFRCEYNNAYGRYICCGIYDANNYNYNYGNMRMYPGTARPLQCFRKDQCLWVDTPNCVYSIRYKQNVCCSTFNC